MTASTPEQARIRPARQAWIDTAKGIAILLVLIVHSSFWTYTNENSDILIVRGILKFLRYALPPYMALFFVLSGYTFKYKPGVLHQRSRRLLIPYMQWGAIYLILGWISLYIKNASYMSYAKAAFGIVYSRFALFPLECDFNIYLFPHGAAPLWFLTSLFTSYILFLVIIRLETPTGRLYIILSYLSGAFLLSYSPILLPWSLDVAPLGAIFLYIGYLMKKIDLFSNKTSRLIVLTLNLIPLYVLLVHINGGTNLSVREYGINGHFAPLLFLFIGSIGSFLYCSACLLTEKIQLSNVFAYIGRISLTILCSHMLAYGVIRIALSKKSPLYCSLFSSSQYLFIVEILAAIILAIIIEEGKKLILSKKRVLKSPL